MATRKRKFGDVRVRGWRGLAWAALVLTLVVVHVTLLGTGRLHIPAGLLLMVVLETMAIGMVFMRWWRSPGEARQLWFLLGLAMLLQLSSGTLNLASSLTAGYKAHQLLAVSSLLSGLYIIPLMFMIARTFSRDMTRMVHLLDVLLAGCAMVLLFALVYYTDVTPPAILALHVGELVFLADSVNYSLAIMLTVRVLGSVTGMRRHAYLATSIFLWTHVLAVSAQNRIGEEPWPWWLFLLMDLSIVAVLLVTIMPTPRWVRHLRPSSKMIGVVDGFAPIVLTISVLALGISVSRLSFGVGMVVSVISVLFYGLRMAYLHSRDRDREIVVTRSNQRLQQQLGTDPLTGIANRITLDMRLPSMLEASRTGRSPCSVLMVDIDYFKQYNDHFGHIAGDHCLQQVVAALHQGLLRAGDLLSRYGGEEFVAVLPDTSERAARMVAERLVRSVADCDIKHPESPYERVTVSVGVSNCTSCRSIQAMQLLDEADQALYRAKRGGRNRTATLNFVQEGWTDSVPRQAEG